MSFGPLPVPDELRGMRSRRALHFGASRCRCRCRTRPAAVQSDDAHVQRGELRLHEQHAVRFRAGLLRRRVRIVLYERRLHRRTVL